MGVSLIPLSENVVGTLYTLAPNCVLCPYYLCSCEAAFSVDIVRKILVGCGFILLKYNKIGVKFKVLSGLCSAPLLAYIFALLPSSLYIACADSANMVIALAYLDIKK